MINLNRAFKKPSGALLAVFLFAALSARAVDYTWTNTAGGDWSVAANWSPNQVPGASDTAAITATGNYTVTVSSAQSIGALTLGASSGDGTVQTLAVTSSTFTVNSASDGTAQGTLSMSGGALAGTGTLTLAGPLNWSGGTIYASVQFNGGAIGQVYGLNGGTLINTGTLALTPYLYDGNGSVISNAAGGIINLTLNNSPITANAYGGAAPVFYNAGLINVSGAGFSGSMGDDFINTGTVSIASGTLDLNGGGTNAGAFGISSGATLQLGNTYNLSAASSVTGAGNVNFSGGTISPSGTYNIAGTNIFSGASVNFSGNYTITNQPLVISSGEVTLTAGGNVNLTGLTLTGGSLSAGIPLLISGPLNWSGGTIYASVQFNGGAIGQVYGLNGGTLINTGTLALTPYLYDGNGSVISNAAGGIINLTLNNSPITANAYGGAAPVFYNAGLINVSGAGFSGSMGDDFINTGTVSIASGTLDLNGGGTNAGAFGISSGATLQLGNTYNLSAASSVTGAGNVNFSGGTISPSGTYNIAGTNIFSGASVNFSGNYTITNQPLVISSGEVTLGAGGNVNLTGLTLTGGSLSAGIPLLISGPLNWSGGTIYASVQFNGGAIGQVYGLNGGTLINTGTLALTPYLYDGNGSVISNAAGGIINLTLNNSPITANAYGGAAPVFYNAGLINVSGAGFSGSMGDDFINTGTVSIASGTLDLNGGGTNAGAFGISSGATLQLGNTYNLSAASSVTGAGNVNFSGGTISPSGTYNIAGTNIFSGASVNFSGNYTITNQPLVISSGEVTLGAGGNVNLTGLTLTGGSLSAGFPVLISGPLNWSGGTIYASVQFNGGAIGQVYGLNGGTLINTGTLALTPYLYDGNGSVISNAAGGIINLTLNNSPITANAYGGTAPVFYNAGLINVSGAGFSGSMGDDFINTGTVSLESGTLDLGGGGMNAGAFVISSGATLQLGGSYNLSAASSVTGAGNVNFSGGTISPSGTYNIAGTNIFSGASVNFSGNYTITNQPLVISSGEVTLGAGGNVNLTGLTLTGGSLSAGFPVLISGPLNWSGGTIYASVQFNGGAIGQVYGLNGGTLINTGTLALTPYLYDGNGSVISNAAGGIINLTLNNSPITANAYGGAAPVFYNAGLINVSGAGFSGSMSDNFINTGTVSLESGTLNLNSSYDLTNGVLNFGLNSAANFGQVSLAGNPASLAGTISATFNSNYFPLVGAAFDVIHFSSSAGAFANTNLPSIAVWQTAYNPANVTITLLKWVPQLTWTNPADIVYGNPLNGTQLNASAVSPTNPGVSLAGSFAYTPPLGAALLAGNGQTLSVTFTPADLATYTNVGANVTIDVLPAPLTVTASALSKTYGQTETFAGTGFTTVGLKYSDSVTSVSLTSPGAVATAPVAGSPYPIIPSAAVGSGLANYTISYVDGNLAVKPAPLAVSANPASRNYGAANPAFSAALSGFVNGETASVVSGAPVLSTLATVTSAVGTYSITPSLGTLTAANYTFGPFVSGLLTVNPAPLTITANSRSKTYGQTVTFAGTEFAAAGLVNGDTITSVTLSSSGAAASAGVAGSPYAITPSAAVGSDVGNYAITYVPGTLTVSPATLTVTANNRSKTYGQTVTFAGTEFAAAGLLNSDTITSVTLSSSGAAANAGVAGSPYAITPSAAVGSGVGNYAIAYVPGTLTVSPATLTVTANNRSKTYGQTVTFAGTEFAAAGLLNSDTITSVTLSSSGAAANAGVAGSPYAITPSAAVGSGVGNYAITYASGTLTVIPAPLTITADNRTKTFGQTVTFAGTEFTASGLLNSDTVASVTLTSAGAAASATVAGSPYSIVPSAALGSGLGNYAISYVDGLLTVTVSAPQPYLSFAFSRPNLILSWTTNASTFVLSRTASLKSPITWTPVTTGITINGSSNTITINADSGDQYYVLIAP